MATPQDIKAMRDPFQGFDIEVTVKDAAGGTDSVLSGAFTGFMCRLVNQVEAYLTIGRRVPRMLDGEIIIGWSLEQGLVSNSPIKDTYGEDFAKAYSKGRLEPLPRQRRFHITMATNVDSIPDYNGSLDLTEAVFRTDLQRPQLAMTLDIKYARVDTGSFGMVAGKRVASSSWQGTGEYIVIKTSQT